MGGKRVARRCKGSFFNFLDKKLKGWHTEFVVANHDFVNVNNTTSFLSFSSEGKKLKKLQKGFTLLELILVATIVGIIAVFALLGLNPMEQVRKAKDTGRISKAKELITAAESYFVFQQTDPADCEALITAQKLKAGSCEGVTLISSSGTYQVTFTPESKAYQDKCGGATCTLPDDLF